MLKALPIDVGGLLQWGTEILAPQIWPSAPRLCRLTQDWIIGFHCRNFFGANVQEETSPVDIATALDLLYMDISKAARFLTTHWFLENIPINRPNLNLARTTALIQLVILLGPSRVKEMEELRDLLTKREWDAAGNWLWYEKNYKLKDICIQISTGQSNPSLFYELMYN